MKKLITVQIEIPAEADNDECLKELLEDLKKRYNRQHSKSQSVAYSSSVGNAHWHYPYKDATIINVKDNDAKTE